VPALHKPHFMQQGCILAIRDRLLRIRARTPGVNVSVSVALTTISPRVSKCPRLERQVTSDSLPLHLAAAGRLRAFVIHLKSIAHLAGNAAKGALAEGWRAAGCVCRKPRPFDLVKESRNVGHVLFVLLRLLLSPFRPISRLEAENAALRRQLMVLQHQVRGRVQFTNSDRLFFLLLYRWFPSKGRHEHSEIDISLQPAESGVVAYRTAKPLRGFARQVYRCR
jgi:hypothetical protein